MLLLAFNLTLLEIIILQLGAIILGIAIYFFWTSNKALTDTLKKSKSKLDTIPMPKKTLHERVGFGNSTLEDVKQREVLAKYKPVPEALARKKPTQQQEIENDNKLSIASLKETLDKQQQTINILLEKMGAKEEAPDIKKNLLIQNEELEIKIEKLELQLYEKEEEIKRIKQQETIAKQMASRIDEVYKEFDELQHKIAPLEKQAGKTNALMLELEDAKQVAVQLQKELERKQDKLEELIAESQRLHATLGITEDKLAEANMQRQQLQKKVQFLQEVNNDMQHVTESNQKLQNELRRIGELESMLSMIAEERDRLLNKGQ